jgi:hypothetical protein
MYSDLENKYVLFIVICVCVCVCLSVWVVSFLIYLALSFSSQGVTIKEYF